MIQSRKRTTLLTLMGAAFMALALLVPMAQAQEPAEGYEQFAGCPADDPSVGQCIVTTIDGGHFAMGNKDVPISNPITLSGGFSFTKGFVANSKGGLTPVKQQVPGGVIGLTGLDWLVNFLGIEALKLYAVTELAGQPSSPFGDPIKLPIKVHLINPVLGSSCYVGSDENPIDLRLTTKTTSPPPPNEPISGTPPKSTPPDEMGILRLNDGTFVDNSFAAPGANGCKLTLFGFIPISLNGLVNTASGLPSPAGTNETTQDFDIEAVVRNKVYP